MHYNDFSPVELPMLGLIIQSLSDSEATVALLGILLVIGGSLWSLLQWIAASPTRPDPWGEEIAGELTRGDCPQLCHRCFTPHDASAHFCSECGATVGTYTCILPPLCYYSIGDVMRPGTEGTYRRSALLIGGFFIAALSYVYWVIFPLGVICLVVYWVKLFKHIPKNRSPGKDDPGPPPEPPG